MNGVMAIGAERLPVGDVEAVLWMSGPRQDVVSSEPPVLVGFESARLTGVSVSVEYPAAPLLNLGLVGGASANVPRDAAFPVGVAVAFELFPFPRVRTVGTTHGGLPAVPRAETAWRSALRYKAGRDLKGGRAMLANQRRAGGLGFRCGGLVGQSDVGSSCFEGSLRHGQIIPSGPVLRRGRFRFSGGLGRHGDGRFLRSRSVLCAGAEEALAGGSRAW